VILAPASSFHLSDYGVYRELNADRGINPHTDGLREMFIRLLAVYVGFILFPPIHTHAQYQIIEIERIQLATSLSAVVTDFAGTRMQDVLVEELSSDWNQSLRSTKTDAKGRFTFLPVKGRDIYFLQLRVNGFDPLRVRVKIDPKQGKKLRLKLEIAT
jgi:hypothetical protein